MTQLLFLSSQDSTSWFPQNNNQSFRIKLPTSLKLEGKWKCALTEVTYTPDFSGEKPSEIYVCCDIVQESYGLNSTLPILRKLNVPETKTRIQHIFPQNIYIELSQEEIQYIHIYIKTQDLQDPSFGSEPFTCTLHICKSEA
jgi:hypothetical protein